MLLTTRTITVIVSVGLAALLATSCRSSTTSDAATAHATRTTVGTETAATAPAPQTPSPHAERSELGRLLDQLIEGTRLPAVGITAFTSERVIETEVAGVRRAGDPTQVELSDQFSIGSNAKAMSATLVATLVDDGVIGWDTAVADAYGEAIPGMDPSWAAITLRQLLSHTSGIDDGGLIPTLAGLDLAAPVSAQRRELLNTITATALRRAPGDYAYSNIGYTIVAAMLEELTGASWEDLIQTRVFDRVGMDSCGFYAPGTPGEVDQPWGHFDELDGRAMDPGDPEADLPPVIAPAGMVHCNMADWVRFLQSQLRGFRGSKGEFVSPEGFRQIQTPADGSDYVLGWLTGPGPDGAVAFYHHGSNQRFTAEVWMAPSDDWGLITVTNIGETIADPLLQKIDQAMFDRRNAR